MSVPIKVVSSKATQALLAELVQAFQARSGCSVALESVGGINAAQRVRAGERFDAVVLACNVIDDLLADGHLRPASKVDVVISSVAVAVRAGTTHPDISSEGALKQAVLSARSIGYSTGPSGVALARLFERWGIVDKISERVVVASPGVPVASLVASGEAELGFQQLSELMHCSDVDVVGLLPAPIQIVTRFSAAIGAHSPQPTTVRQLLQFLASEAAVGAKRRHGLEPA